MAKNDLQGALDLLVLKTLSQRGELHGYGIALHIEIASDELLRVEAPRHAQIPAIQANFSNITDLPE